MRTRSMLTLLAALDCSPREPRPPPAPVVAREPSRSETPDETESSLALDEDFPLHGLVVGAQLVVRASPEPEGRIIGWLRAGERVRLKPNPTRTATCNTGWFELAPRGHACAGQGIEVADTPPRVDEPIAPAKRDEPLPYLYYFVKDPLVPQYHQLPSRQQQRDAETFTERYLQLHAAGHERRAAQLMAGALPGEPTRPAIAAQLLQRGFFVAGTDVLVRADRRFVRTTSGGFVKEVRLERRNGSEHRGVELDDTQALPIPFVLRDIQPRIRRELADGTVRFVRDLEAGVLVRQTIAASWRGRERQGDDWYHRFEDEAWDGPRFARDWFVGVAEQIEPPFEVEPAEPWVHVDLSSQTLVLYRGPRPVFATIVSSGVDGHTTPTGTFTIRRKLVTDTMADLGPDSEENYRIQDVPWTQYFEGSFALHGAFWHTGFGVPRSHGCVNLAPYDAQRIFHETWPLVPAGWHGVSAEQSGFRGSRVHITE